MAYQLTNTSFIVRIGDGAYIPPDPANRDYAEYLAWLASGNTPDPADVTPFADLKEAYLVQVRETRERILNRLAGIGAAAIVSGDTVMQQAFVSARQSLLYIMADADVAAATDIDGLKAAVLAAYRNIVASAPAAIVDAFNTVDE